MRRRDKKLIYTTESNYDSYRSIMTPDSTQQLTILLFEDNAADADLISQYLLQSNLCVDVVRVPRLAEGLAALKERRFDLVLLDLSLPDSLGLETLQAVAAVGSDAVIIVLTDSEDEPLSLQSLQAGAQDYLFKDRLSAELLRRSIGYAMERSSLLTRVESKMREVERSEALLRQVFDASADAKLILAENYAIRFLNLAAAQLLEADSASLLGEVFPFGVQVGERTEFEIPASDGSTRFVELNAVDLTWEGARALLVVLRDVTARRCAELALRREKERLSVTLDTIADGVITIDSNGIVERVNHEAARLTGVAGRDAVGQRLADVLVLRHPKSGQLILDSSLVFLSEEYAEITPELGISLLSRDGQEFQVTAEMRCMLNDHSEQDGCVLVLRDVTTHKQTEGKLFEAEQFQSISLLASGIAHDFNNILTAVLGNVSMVRIGMDAGGAGARKLLAAEKAVLQATSLTQQLLTFSKGGTPQLQATSIDQLVEDCAQFILRGSNVKCEVHKAPHLWAVDADPGQISQVVNNLLINADQAMSSGGTIGLSLTCETVRGGSVPSLPSGDYVCITVQDQGCGIAPENLKRIFDPYFTTKQEGNGLGLASSYSIIQRHRGLMTVDSVVGAGSTFKVYLPKSMEAVVVSAELEVTDDRIYPGEGRILVMDDMEAMAMVAGEVLGVLGYDVAFATHGAEAIEAYKQAKAADQAFDAVIFDLTVPGGMGGEEACQILLQYDPDLVAVASSGYTTSNVMSEYERAGFKAVVPKPYRIKEMSAVLHRVLS